MDCSGELYYHGPRSLPINSLLAQLTIDDSPECVYQLKEVTSDWSPRGIGFACVQWAGLSPSPVQLCLGANKQRCYLFAYLIQVVSVAGWLTEHSDWDCCWARPAINLKQWQFKDWYSASSFTWTGRSSLSKPFKQFDSKVRQQLNEWFGHVVSLV